MITSIDSEKEQPCMFSIKYEKNQTKVSHYIRAPAPPARNECRTTAVIFMQHQQNARKM